MNVDITGRAKVAVLETSHDGLLTMTHSKIIRTLLSIAIVFHLLAVVGSLSYGTPVGDEIRTFTRPYEKLAGVYQNWNMFAPNPPKSAYWMEIVGFNEDGESQVIRSLVGPLPDRAIEPRYRRLFKLERTMLQKNKGLARKGLVQWLCAQDPALKKIKISRITLSTPRPLARRDNPHATSIRTVTPIQTRSCP